jgi:hypothetical protein
MVQVGVGRPLARVARIRRALRAHRLVRATVRVAAQDAAKNWTTVVPRAVRIVG